MTSPHIPSERAALRLPGLLLPLLLTLPAAALVGACTEMDGDEEFDGFETVEQPLDAMCTIRVQNQGTLEVETNYLAHVVKCENGAADTEALKAQAVSARSYAYYKIRAAGASEIGDGQHDQVYGCGRAPGPEHYAAVEATSGQILRYRNTYVAAFYVAGAIPSTDTCRPAGGDRDPTNTERYVTYNEGRSGDNLEQTTLGWVNSGNHANRGCKSQNGANCLSQRGRSWQEIIHFYYGDDIEITQTEGACVGEPEPEPDPCQTTVGATGETVIDDQNACFARSCRTGSHWWDEGAGIDGHVYTTYTTADNVPDCSGRWNLQFGQAGDYTLYVHLVDPVPASQMANYRIHHNGAVSEVIVSQRGVNGWLELGSFTFAAQGEQYVQLDDNTGEPYVDMNGVRVVFDAIRLIPTSEVPANNGGMNNEPSNNEPSNNAPVNNEPSNNAPANNAPANNEPGNNGGGANNAPVNNDARNNSVGNNGGDVSNNDGLDPGTNGQDNSTQRVNSYEESCSVSAPSRPATTWPVWGVLALVALGLVVRR